MKEENERLVRDLDLNGSQISQGELDDIEEQGGEMVPSKFNN